jgi:hypothetical protein
MPTLNSTAPPLPGLLSRAWRTEEDEELWHRMARNAAAAHAFSRPQTEPYPNRARDDALPVAAIPDALDAQVGYPAAMNLEIGLPQEKIVTDLFEADIFSDNWARGDRGWRPPIYANIYYSKCAR